MIINAFEKVFLRVKGVGRNEVAGNKPVTNNPEDEVNNASLEFIKKAQEDAREIVLETSTIVASLIEFINQLSDITNFLTFDMKDELVDLYKRLISIFSFSANIFNSSEYSRAFYSLEKDKNHLKGLEKELKDKIRVQEDLLNDQFFPMLFSGGPFQLIQLPNSNQELTFFQILASLDQKKLQIFLELGRNYFKINDAVLVVEQKMEKK